MAMSELAARAGVEGLAYLQTLSSSSVQVLATGAAALGIGLVVAGAFVRTMLPLRWLAAGSNAALIVFGALHPSIVTLVIAAAVLPINIVRAIEMTRLTRRVRSAQANADLAGLWLKPYMKPRRLKAGQTLFHKGDTADRLFLLVDGEMELSDIGKRLEPGRIFGEIALFSPNRLRTHTVHCVSGCTVLEIHESTVMQLYYQHPAFGFHLIELLAGRMSADVERSEARLSRADRTVDTNVP